MAGRHNRPSNPSSSREGGARRESVAVAAADGEGR